MAAVPGYRQGRVVLAIGYTFQPVKDVEGGSVATSAGNRVFARYGPELAIRAQAVTLCMFTRRQEAMLQKPLYVC